MEHPLIGDLSALTLDELNRHVTDLQKKLAVAQRMGNAHLCGQIRMALESYTNKYQDKLQEQYRASGGPDFGDKIDIS